MVKKRGKSILSVCTDDYPFVPGFAKTPGRNAVIPNEADAGGRMREPPIYLSRFMDKGIPDPPDVGSGMTLVLIVYC